MVSKPDIRVAAVASVPREDWRGVAKRLVLIHISDELDWEWARAEAAERFQGPVEVAKQGDVYEV